MRGVESGEREIFHTYKRVRVRVPSRVPVPVPCCWRKVHLVRTRTRRGRPKDVGHDMLLCM